MADNEHLETMYSTTEEEQASGTKSKLLVTTSNNLYVTLLIDGKPTKVPSVEYVSTLEKQVKTLQDEVKALTAKLKNVTIRANNSDISISGIRKDIRNMTKPTPRDDF